MLQSLIRDILARSGDLSIPAAQIAPEADLFAAGLSSFGTVEVMVALEETFGAAFPDHLLTRETFRTIASLCAAAEKLRELAPTA